MNTKKGEYSLKERLRALTNQNKNENINSFTFLKRLNNSNDKNFNFNNFVQLKSKVFENHSNIDKKYLKNRRLNQIFNKDIKYSSNNFINKFREVFNETCQLNNSKCNNFKSNGNDNSLNELNSKLLLYINKIKKENDKSKIKNDTVFNAKFYDISINDRKNNKNLIYNYFYDDYFKNKKSSSSNKIKKLKNEILYKNKIHTNNFNKYNKMSYSSNIIKNKYVNYFKNNNNIKMDWDKNFGKTVNNSFDFFHSVKNNTNNTINNNNSLFSIKKNMFDKKYNFYKNDINLL